MTVDIFKSEGALGKIGNLMLAVAVIYLTLILIQTIVPFKPISFRGVKPATTPTTNGGNGGTTRMM